MRIFVPLKQSTLAKLWAGQLFSAVGDEVNRVAIVWLAASLWGNESGYLMAVNAGCAFLFSILAGSWVERFDRRRLMIATDLVRAAAVLMVPLGAWLGLPLKVLLPVSIGLCGGFSMFFDPALKAVVPALIPSPELRNATNALMESATRFARCFGPGLVAAASALIPMMHFFTFDGATYLCSALLIAFIPRRSIHHVGSSEQSADLPLFPLINRDPVAAYGLYSGVIVNAAWTLVLPLGIGLVVHTRVSGDVSALGTVLMAYGVGNLAANLLVGSWEDGRPERLLFFGRCLAGIGFVCFAASSTPLGLMLSAGFAAMGGPVSDVGMLGMLQQRYTPHELGRVYRGYLTLHYAGIFALFCISPTLFNVFGVERVIFCAAVVILAAGSVGLFKFGRVPSLVPAKS